MKLLFAFALCACTASCAGCGTDEPTLPGRDFTKEMIDSQPYDAFAPNPVTRDHKTLQAPAPGSLPRGYTPFDYGPGPAEAARAAQELVSPLPQTAENAARGDQLFHTFCFECHGNEGKGDGPIIPRFPGPPSLLAPHARGLADGQIVHIISRGQGLMPAHATQVQYVDRFRLVQYLRLLQAQTPLAAAPAVPPGARP